MDCGKSAAAPKAAPSRLERLTIAWVNSMPDAVECTDDISEAAHADDNPQDLRLSTKQIVNEVLNEVIDRAVDTWVDYGVEDTMQKESDLQNTSGWTGSDNSEMANPCHSEDCLSDTSDIFVMDE